MRIAVLVKQIPKFEEMELQADGRLRREGVDLEMNPYCRRAVSKGVELASEHAGSSVTVFTLGPACADDTLREAIAWGLARDVATHGVLVSDTAFAGSDTLATAKAIAATLVREGPFDLVLTGRNSVDADTGQVGPELAELLDLPFLTGVRYLALNDGLVHAQCEHDDGFVQVEVELPAIISCAERLCEPTKVDPPGRAAVSAELIRTVTAADLGSGPWGAAASPTSVGRIKTMAIARAHLVWPEAPVSVQVADAVRALHDRGALDVGVVPITPPVPGPRTDTPRIMVLLEPDRAHLARELVGAAACLTGNVTSVAFTDLDALALSEWGADRVVFLDGENVEEDVARAVCELVDADLPWAILTGSTAWGREVASRVAAHLGAGLVGDAVELERDHERLTAWKPAFGGQLVAAITYTGTPQIATVRPGVLATPALRVDPQPALVQTIELPTRGRVRVLKRARDDDIDTLADARAVIGVGRGVAPDEYPALEPLRLALGAELGATRKVTDEGWLPRARQIGITGRSIAPHLFVSVGASGKFNHTVGIRAAAHVLAINPNPEAPIFEHADVGIIGDWREVVPLLVAQLRG